MPTEEVETTLRKKEEAANMDEENTRLNVARRKRGFFAGSSGDTAYLKVIPEARAKRKKVWFFQCRVFPRRVARGKPQPCPLSAARGNVELR